MVITWTLEAGGAALGPASLLTSSMTSHRALQSVLPLHSMLLVPTLLHNDEEMVGVK